MCPEDRSWLFALSSVLKVFTQLPVPLPPCVCKAREAPEAGDRLDLRRSMTAGLRAARYVILLNLGRMPVVPTARARVPDLAQAGLWTGALSLSAACSSGLLGAVLRADQQGTV
ncbi:hypothetical protein ACF09Y_18630 [Streptomyces massasporeus]|uniref:hypothetical protein n=1 Tax=Streptomyces massasporeus TaxID=67324 RepID=UPI0036F6DCEB